MLSKIKGIVAKVSESDFESVVRGAGSTKGQVILDVGLRLCGVNKVFDSKDFVYTNRTGKLCLSTVLLCRSLVYVEDDDEDNETRPSHLI